MLSSWQHHHYKSVPFLTNSTGMLQVKLKKQFCLSDHPSPSCMALPNKEKKQHPLWKQKSPLQTHCLSKRGSEARQIPQWNWYSSLHCSPHLQLLFSISGDLLPPSLGTQSLIQQPTSSSITPGAVTGGISTLWLFYMCLWLKARWTSEEQCSSFAECFAWGLLPSLALSGWLDPD